MLINDCVVDQKNRYTARASILASGCTLHRNQSPGRERSPPGSSLRSGREGPPSPGTQTQGQSRPRPGFAGSHGVADLRPAARDPGQNLRPATRDPVRPGPCPGHSPRIEDRGAAWRAPFARTVSFIIPRVHFQLVVMSCCHHNLSVGLNVYQLLCRGRSKPVSHFRVNVPMGRPVPSTGRGGDDL